MRPRDAPPARIRSRLRFLNLDSRAALPLPLEVGYIRLRPFEMPNSGKPELGGRGGAPSLPIRAAYPKWLLLRCDLEVRSISRNIHTRAAPKPTTMPRNSNVRPGAVSMASIHGLNAVYQCRRRTSGWH